MPNILTFVLEMNEAIREILAESNLDDHTFEKVAVMFSEVEEKVEEFRDGGDLEFLGDDDEEEEDGVS